MNFFFIRKITKQEKQTKCIYSAFLLFGCKNVGLRDLRFTKPTYTQKNQHFDAKSAKNLHILKKIKKFDSEKSPNLHILKKNKSFDSEKSPNLHILKKIKKIKNQVIYASESHIESEIFDFFDFF